MDGAGEEGADIVKKFRMRSFRCWCGKVKAPWRRACRSHGENREVYYVAQRDRLDTSPLRDDDGRPESYAEMRKNTHLEIACSNDECGVVLYRMKTPWKEDDIIAEDFHPMVGVPEPRDGELMECPFCRVPWVNWGEIGHGMIFSLHTVDGWWRPA